MPPDRPSPWDIFGENDGYNELLGSFYQAGQEHSPPAQPGLSGTERDFQALRRTFPPSRRQQHSRGYRPLLPKPRPGVETEPRDGGEWYRGLDESAPVEARTIPPSPRQQHSSGYRPLLPKPGPEVETEPPDEDMPHVNCSPTCICRFVTKDNYPIFPAHSKSKIIKSYIGLGNRRPLDWKRDIHGKSNVRNLHDPSSMAAAIVHSRGVEPSEPCIQCKEGKGIWETCIVDFPSVKNQNKGLPGGICASCWYSRRRNCSLRTDLKSPGSRSTANDIPGGFAEKDVNMEPDPDAASEFSQKVPLRGSGHHAQPPTDGKIVHFSLPAEAVDSLPILRQAVGEMISYLQVVNDRITHLEEQKDRAQNAARGPVME